LNATRDTFQERVSSGVKILHITCHGTYKDDNTTHLSFEDSKELGVMDKFEKANIIEALRNYVESEIKLILVGACNSAEIGKAIK
jgi:CHAT domain-containing protein